MATNSGGGILWNEHYDPYGQKLNGVNEKIGYTGHAYDAETQLTYAQARFYDPAVGRFLSNDPVGFNDGPFSFNRYSYVNNSPYSGTDPMGMCPRTVSGCDGDTSLESIGGDSVGNGNATTGSRIPAAVTAHEGGGAGLSTGGIGGDSAFTGQSTMVAGGGGGGRDRDPMEEFERELRTGENNLKPIDPVQEEAQQEQISRQEQFSEGVNAAPIRDLLYPGGRAIGEAGNNRYIRILSGNLRDAEAFFSNLSRGGSIVEGADFPGTLVRVPGGGWWDCDQYHVAAHQLLISSLKMYLSVR